MTFLIGKTNGPSREQLLYDPKVQDCAVIADSIHFLRRQKPLIKIGVYTGIFDKLRPKDCVFLSLARSMCDMLVVVAPSTYSLRLQKNMDPHPDSKERAFLLASLPFIDWVTIYDEEIPDLAINNINPDMIFYGLDEGDENVITIKKDKLMKIEHPFPLSEKEVKKLPSKYFNIPTE